MTQPENLDIEAPEADAAEQATLVEPDDGDGTVSRSIEAPDWDAEEQSRTVPYDDEYR